LSVNSSTRLLVDTNGLVGINETSPSAQLQVKSGATTRVPLIVDTLASHTAELARFRLNSNAISNISVAGDYETNSGVSSLSGGRNWAYVNTSTTGTIISRNLADTNPALIVNLANASATGPIVRFQKAGTTLASIGNDGTLSANLWTTVYVNSPQTIATSGNTDRTMTATINLHDKLRITWSNRTGGTDFVTEFYMSARNSGSGTARIQQAISGLGNFNTMYVDYQLGTADNTTSSTTIRFFQPRLVSDAGSTTTTALYFTKIERST
jgi:hypothetical protein